MQAERGLFNKEKKTYGIYYNKANIPKNLIFFKLSHTIYKTRCAWMDLNLTMYHMCVSYNVWMVGKYEIVI